jgi:putative endonuclease
VAVVYVLYSPSLDQFYVGSCADLAYRTKQHLSQHFPGAFTGKATDWEMYFFWDNLTYIQARSIEAHIKKMKSKNYIENLKKYPRIMERLVALYQD